MKFRSPTQEPVYLALTSSHTAVVGPELGELEQRFHREAIAEGCIPEGMDAAPMPKQTERTKSEVIDDAIRKMIADAKPEDFTRDGKVDANALSERVGFAVSASERNAAWDKISNDEADKE